ncbi:hypothetical protein MN116_008925 [Schistosoma mekongi]|uniref:Uncharacterized protein n=1 Tax=Schistosoma mekongi TaxID=38744 RepID=A0AAE1Z5F6_SCHME|nr:hypothetical protein MN116_008925 [Schistosoma mekongi]
MMLPFGVFVSQHRLDGRRPCWVRMSYQFLHAYHTLFSNFGPIQTIILLILNLKFLLFIRKYLRNRFLQQCTTNTQCINRKEIRICMLNLILSSSYIVISLPQAICILLARMPFASMTRIHRMIAYDIGRLMWSLNSVRKIADFVVYAIYFKPLTDLLFQCYANFTLLYHRCLKYVITKTNDGEDSKANNITDKAI